MLFAFDASSLGTGKSIASAYLHIYETSCVRNGVTSTVYKVTNNWLEGLANWYNRQLGVSWTSQGGDYDSNCYSPNVTLPTTDGKWIAYNITTPFNSHYTTSINDIYDKGFLVTRNGTSGDNTTIAMREYSTVYLRPRLSVMYRGTMFGADVGDTKNWYAAPTPTIAAGTRIQKAKDDNLKIIRMFEDTTLSTGIQAQYFCGFAEECSTRSMKLILVFQPSAFRADGMEYGPENFKERIRNILENGTYPVQNYIQNHTIAAIQIGNEEEGKWGYEQPPVPTPTTTPSLDTGRIYYAGCDYALFYLKARDYLKGKFAYLDIIGGCVVDHKALGFTYATPPVPSKTYVPTPYRKDNNGKSAYAFLNGFVQEVMARQTPGPSTEKLPDLIDIHGYPDTYPPEFTDDFGAGGTREWRDRLDQLQDLFDFYDYSPRFCITEWGFSPNTSKMHACSDANEKTQSVYYLRRAVIDATMRRNDSDPTSKYFDCSIYWQHAYNVDDPQGDTMWHRSTHYNVPRHIQQVGSVLHNDSSGSYPGLQNAIVWKPAKSDRAQISNDADGGDNTMMCGWINAAGVRWGAIWRYRWNSISYWIPTPTPKSFQILSSEISPTITPGPAYLYKFDVPVTPPPTPSPIWKQVSTTPIQPVRTPGNSTWYYPIPADYVNENPVFLKFDN